MQSYAGFFRRLVASIIDIFIIILLMAFIQFVTGIREEIFYYVLIILFSWSYFAYQESSVYQGTVGKQAMNIIITDLDGRRISFACATKRFMVKVLASLPFFAGFLPVFINKNRQGIHDKIAKTLVIVREDWILRRSFLFILSLYVWFPALYSAQPYFEAIMMIFTLKQLIDQIS